MVRSDQTCDIVELGTLRTKQSILWGRIETAAGAFWKFPPIRSQPPHAPSKILCHSALSVPRTKRSKRFGLHEETAGLDPTCTVLDGWPRLFQPPQLEP